MGEGKKKPNPAQIVILTPNYFKSIMESRTASEKMALNKVNMIIFDEADELLTVIGNEGGINLIKSTFDKFTTKP